MRRPGHRYLVADLTAPRDLARLQSMTRLNIDALVSLSHTYSKAAKPGDALINVSSMLAILPMPAAGTYAATKAFVTSFSESLWHEQKKRGVYVMGFCPGITISRFHERAGGKEETFRKSMAQTSDMAVKHALRALARRSRPTVVSGWRNVVLAALPRFLGRKQVVSMMGSASP